MLLFSLAFLAGILLLQFFSTLPSLGLALAAMLSCLFLSCLPIRGRHFLIPFLFGFAFCLWYAHSIAKFSLLPEWEGKTIWIKGKVASLPHVSTFHTSFLFQVDELRNNMRIQKVATRFTLSWPHSDLNHSHLVLPTIGDEWLLPVRLKKIHSMMNPGGFDFEAWAFQNGIRATGLVLEKEKPLFISNHFWFHPVDHLRYSIQEKIKQILPTSQSSPWLLALMIGERAGIPQAAWEVLRKTGTNHLMAIAGLHIGFISALAHWLTLCFWRRPQGLMLLPAKQAAAAVSLVMAFLYSALAGFSIPTQRALIMVAVYLGVNLSRRVIPLWQPWSLALLLVLLINPLSVLSSSFWLSFMTLALILYGLRGRLVPERSWWWKWGSVQGVLALGLLPLCLGFFMQYSWVSFVANLIAIPWIGFLVLPLCFLTVIFLWPCHSLAQLFLLGADKSLALLWSILIWFSKLSWGNWYQALPPQGFLIMAMGGVFILLLPRGFPGKYLGFLCLLPLLVFKPPTPSRGELRFSLLDVGQGLSAVIQTQKHLLVFDTGPRLGPEADRGEAIVLPFLRAQGIKKVDMLVISHGDNDHSGGAQAILSQLPVASLETSVPLRFTAWPAEYCLAGKAWVWDEVHFAFLYPTPAQLNLGNDSCCVLQIKTQQKTILLPGDIEKKSEKFLLSYFANQLAADLLVAPHHGSQTSGLPAFIAQVHPEYVLYAIGYRNRYHFPHPKVRQTYQQLGVLQYDTVSQGAIQFEMGKDYLFPSLFYREMKRRYWND